MTNINIEVKGLKNLRKTFKTLNADSTPQLSKALNKGILVFDAEAAKQSPVDTGILRNTREITPSTPSTLTSKLNFTTEYAAAVHQGVQKVVRVRSRNGRVFTRKVNKRPNPYATRAVEIKQDRALDVINDTIAELLR